VGIVRHDAVALVGGGPGDPELLTLAGEARLRLAGVVVADTGLVALAGMFAVRARIVPVAERRPAVTALRHAASRHRGPVVRLYRGDPWLHPAYAVELAALTEAGVATESTPGVAVEIAGPGRAGVPLHVRHLAVVCTVGPYESLPAATDPTRTLVATGDDPARMVGMVVAAGDGRLPAALVSLDDPMSAWRGRLAEAIQAAGPAGPALLVVGEVCRVRPDSHQAARVEAS